MAFTYTANPRCPVEKHRRPTRYGPIYLITKSEAYINRSSNPEKVTPFKARIPTLQRKSNASATSRSDRKEHMPGSRLQFSTSEAPANDVLLPSRLPSSAPIYSTSSAPVYNTSYQQRFHKHLFLTDRLPATIPNFKQVRLRSLSATLCQDSC